MKPRIAKMKEGGLQPSTTGGKETGQSVTQYLFPDGRFAHAASKTKYTCPACSREVLRRFGIDVDCAADIAEARSCWRPAL
jgi:hypothetical protein